MSAFEVFREPPEGAEKNRNIFLFDIDNTLYRKATGVGELMHDYISRYIEHTLQLTREEAEDLQSTYYKHYGLSVEGLVRKNHINAMDYNEKVDDALPLETLLKPDHKLQEMLSRIDRKKWRLWLCTNAYRNHGIRVIKLLGIEEYFEGMTYCDYNKQPMICKPMDKYFITCMEDLGVKMQPDGKPFPKVYFVDDSIKNVEAAEKYGWISYQIQESLDKEVPNDMSVIPLLDPLHENAPYRIQYIYQLPRVCPELFE